MFENNEQLPSNIHNVPWLHFSNDDTDAAKTLDKHMEEWEQQSKDMSEYLEYLEHHTSHILGKWMLFYPKDDIDNKWILAKSLCAQEKLGHCFSLKVSTMYNNPRASSSDEKVIIFYCYGCQEHIIETGRTIICNMSYKNKNGRIYFKRDTDTFKGTRATGCERNYSFSLECPREYMFVD